MIYSDSTSKQGLLEDTAFWCGSTAGTLPSDYTSDDFKRNIKEWYRKAVTIILKSVTGWRFMDTTATTNLISGIRSYQLSSASGLNISNLIKIDRVEVSYDGTNWYRALPIDVSTIKQALNSSTFDVDASLNDETNPKYALREDYIDLYPKPKANVTNGLKIYYIADIGDFGATTTDIPKIPADFHRILSLGAAYDYLKSRNQIKAEAIFRDITFLEKELSIFISGRDTSEEFTMTAKYKNYE